MGELTEREIFGCMAENFSKAAECCVKLAEEPKMGPTYRQLRTSLKLIEGCCRQAAYWREDGRWLPMGLVMEEAHKRAGYWLRYHHPRPLFLKLAENLRGAHKAAEMLKNMKTGTTGLILPNSYAPQQIVQQIPQGNRPRLIT
jgi:hypothetical protein